MQRFFTIAFMVATAGVFAWVVPLPRLFAAFQPVVVALSIMVAALLVRLNRGMPTLDWKAVPVDRRNDLTTKIVDLTREYASVLLIDTVLLVLLVALTVVGKTDLATWPDPAQRATSTVLGAVMALSIARMAYVVWRDLDIVRLQKAVIDEAAKAEQQADQEKLASDKAAAIKSSNVRAIGSREPRNWDA